MAYPTLEALATLVPVLETALPVVTKLLSSISDSEPSASMKDVPAPVLQGARAPMDSLDPGARVLSAPPLPSSAHTLTSPIRPGSLSIEMPFQFNFYDLTGTEKNSTSLDIAGKDVITTLIGPYRHARLTHLEAVLFPTAASLKYPQTVDAVWTPHNTTISDNKIMATYGSQRITVGGPFNVNSNSTLPADLALLNPVIKDSVSYVDTPRLCVRFHQNSDSMALGIKAPISASIFIRGKLLLSSPTVHST